jgi:hypothetical protein
MGKLLFTLLLAAVGCLVRPTPASLPIVIEIRPETGEQVVLRVERGKSLHVRASAAGLRTEGGRLMELVAPATVEITGGKGELELRSADPGMRFVLGVKREVAGVSRVFEARGEYAVIRVRGSQLELSTEEMTMREVRAP